MQMGYTQINQVVEAGPNPLGSPGSGFRKRQKPTLLFNSGLRIGRKIADMYFVDDRVDHSIQSRPFGRVPAFRVGTVQVDNHPPVTVHPGRPGIGIDHFINAILMGNRIGIIEPMTIAVHLPAPDPTLFSSHRIDGFDPAPSLGISTQTNFPGGWGPDRKDRLRRSVHRT